MLTLTEALRKRMVHYLCEGDESCAPPASWRDYSAIVISKDYVAVPFPVGGMIVPKDSKTARDQRAHALPVSLNAAHGARNDWVVVSLAGHLVAVSLAEAYRRDLREVAWYLPAGMEPKSARSALAGLREEFFKLAIDDRHPEQYDHGQRYLAAQCALVDLLLEDEPLRIVITQEVVADCGRGRRPSTDGETQWTRFRQAWDLALNVFAQARAKKLQAQHLECLSRLPTREEWIASVAAYTDGFEI
jgi:hypothetical protein